MAEPVPLNAPAEIRAWMNDVANRLRMIEQPQRPQLAFPCAQADLPPAARYAFCVVLITDLNILGYSDGTDWRRADTGAPV